LIRILIGFSQFTSFDGTVATYSEDVRARRLTRIARGQLGEISVAKHLNLASLTILILTVTASAQAAGGKSQDANVGSVNVAAGAVELVVATPTGPTSIGADGSAAKTTLAQLHAGDEVRVSLAPGAGNKIVALSIESRYVDWPTRSIALAIAFAIVTFCALVATQWNVGKFLIGADNRYSNSQCQLVIWSAIAITSYLATVLLRYWEGGLDLLGGVQITQNLLILSGLSALTFGAAKAITVTKEGEAGSLKEVNKESPNIFKDLFLNDAGQADIGDFQMILITVIAATIYFWEVWHFLAAIKILPSVTLPDVDTNLLSGFGVGQGAYLIKKMALPLGKG
jgi:hypothetical protein